MTLMNVHVSCSFPRKLQRDTHVEDRIIGFQDSVFYLPSSLIAEADDAARRRLR